MTYIKDRLFTWCVAAILILLVADKVMKLAPYSWFLEIREFRIVEELSGMPQDIVFVRRPFPEPIGWIYRRAIGVNGTYEIQDRDNPEREPCSAKREAHLDLIPPDLRVIPFKRAVGTRCFLPPGRYLITGDFAFYVFDFYRKQFTITDRFEVH